MPQMAPINWLLMFIFMVTIMLIISSLNYFNWLYTPSITKMSKNIKTSWKW